MRLDLGPCPEAGLPIDIAATHAQRLLELAAHWWPTITSAEFTFNGTRVTVELDDSVADLVNRYNAQRRHDQSNRYQPKHRREVGTR